MCKPGPHLQNEGFERQWTLWCVIVWKQLTSSFIVFESFSQSDWKENQKTFRGSGFCRGKKVIFTSLLLILWWLQSSISNLLPHFLCYEMLGIVFPWLSHISTKSQELGWKTQPTLPSFVHPGFLPVLRGKCLSGRQELKSCEVNPATQSHFGSLRDSGVEQHGTSLFWCHKHFNLPKAAPLHQKPFNDGCSVLTKKSGCKAEKMLYCLRFLCSVWITRELKIKPQAESNVSAGTEQDYLSRWVTPHLEEMAFVLLVWEFFLKIIWLWRSCVLREIGKKGLCELSMLS